MEKCNRCEKCIGSRYGTDRVLLIDKQKDIYWSGGKECFRGSFRQKMYGADMVLVIDEHGSNSIRKNRFDPPTSIGSIGVIECPIGNCPERREKKLERIMHG